MQVKKKKKTLAWTIMKTAVIQSSDEKKLINIIKVSTEESEQILWEIKFV